MGWDTKHRGFIDAMKHGYRVHLGDWSDEETQSLANDIEQNLGITGLVFRKRGGYSRRSGEVDMVVPFYFGDDEPISW